MPKLDPRFTILTGYFWKAPPLEKLQGRLLARWKYRWFVLYARDSDEERELELIYYHNEETQQRGDRYIGK